MADEPWLKYQQAAPAADGPWTKYQAPAAAGASPAAPAPVNNLTKPVIDIPKDIGQDFAAGSAQVKQGEADLENPQADLGGRVMGGIRSLVGGAQQVAAPATGTGRALISDPIRNTGLPGSKLAADVVDTGIGMAAPGAEAGALKGLARGGVKAAEGIGSAASKAIPGSVERAPGATSDALKAVAAQHYAAADKAGAVFKPAFRQELIDRASKLAPQEEKAAVGDTELTKLLTRLSVDQDKPLTMKGAQEIDEHLGDLVDKNFISGRLQKEGRDILTLQGHLRDMMAKATADDIQSGRNGAASLAQGRKTFSQAMKVRDIERIDERAKNSDNPAGTFRTGLRSLLNRTKGIGGYDDAEEAAIRKALKTGTSETLIKMFASHGPVKYVGGKYLGDKVLAGQQSNAANRIFNTLGALPGATPIGE